MGFVTFSEEQTNLTVWDELRHVGRKVRLASDRWSATYVFFFVLILWNLSVLLCCRLVSPSAVGLGEKWNGRIVFGDVMQSEGGLCAMFVAIKKWSKK